MFGEKDLGVQKFCEELEKAHAEFYATPTGQKIAKSTWKKSSANLGLVIEAAAKTAPKQSAIIGGAAAFCLGIWLANKVMRDKLIRTYENEIKSMDGWMDEFLEAAQNLEEVKEVD
jgi:hypothetical protein